MITVSDPVHGFIKIREEFMLIKDLLAKYEVQRLRRIKQLGMGFLVFPSAEHTRFPHAVGAMGLLSDALNILQEKGTKISKDERLAALSAILLHDIGHGPFSHTLEFKLIEKVNPNGQIPTNEKPNGISHEDIGKALIRRLNAQMKGQLDLALKMIENDYNERPFFSQLISGQLDVDRLDYLRRDSLFTGVVEGKIGVDRILSTLCVYPKKGGEDSCLAIESKGVYAVENVLVARRLMYWQVYLHKTVVAADAVLHGVIERARDLIIQGNLKAVDGIPEALKCLLSRKFTTEMLNDYKVLDQFLYLDDSAITDSIKKWCESNDPILANLSKRMMKRDLFRCELKSKEEIDELEHTKTAEVLEALTQKGINDPDASKYYIHKGCSRHSTYEPDEGNIRVLNSENKLVNLDKYTQDATFIGVLTDFERKPYLCYPKCTKKLL
ncbi:MAG: HD domain-containing protein [Bacteroidetes bacterium]|nr:HD domain-containing protein [Bacteroidota bacterium]